MQDSTKLLKHLFAVTPFVISKETGQDVMKGPCLPLSGLVKACAGGKMQRLEIHWGWQGTDACQGLAVLNESP